MNSDALLTVRLNGQPHAVPAGTTLAALIAALGQAPNAVGTCVNGVFIPRGQRNACTLNADDAVVLVQPIVGG